MRLSRTFSVGSILFCALVFMFAPKVSVSPTGSIAGLVKDPTGAVISSAKLTLVNIPTNAKVETQATAMAHFSSCNGLRPCMR